jgi:hypothetical protein
MNCADGTGFHAVGRHAAPPVVGSTLAKDDVAMTDDVVSDDVVSVAQLVADIIGLEGDIRARQRALGHVDARHKRTGRTDLMPGRHYAIALTALEEARLRIQEAARLEREP